MKILVLPQYCAIGLVLAAFGCSEGQGDGGGSAASGEPFDQDDTANEVADSGGTGGREANGTGGASDTGGREEMGGSRAGAAPAAGGDGQMATGGAEEPGAGGSPQLPPGTHPDIVAIVDVTGREPGGDGWADSYSVDDQCYCATTFDHNIGAIEVDTPAGTRTVEEVCEFLGAGPGKAGRPIYNDIQCGNGPANDAGDEDDCPGRVDIGREGCGHIGPPWDLTGIE